MGNYRDAVSDVAITVIILLVLLTGLMGTVVPVLPGILLMWGGVVAYGFFVGFGAIGIGAIIIVTLLSGVAVALGFILPKRLADDSGASGKSQIAAVVGGIGNLGGAMAGGLTLGSSESLAPQLILEPLGVTGHTQLKDAVAFLVLIFVLLVKPTGLFGERLSSEDRA